jgi:hypothetical protein
LLLETQINFKKEQIEREKKWNEEMEREVKPFANNGELQKLINA